MKYRKIIATLIAIIFSFLALFVSSCQISTTGSIIVKDKLGDGIEDSEKDSLENQKSFIEIPEVSEDKEGYFKPGDSLRIAVYKKGEQINHSNYTLSDKGRVNISSIGEVLINDMNADQALSVIETAFQSKNEDFSRDWQVYFPWINGKLKVYISGAVRKPGWYDFKTGEKIGSIVKAAGGYLEGADEEKAQISSKGVSREVNSSSAKISAGDKIFIKEIVNL